MDDVTTYESEVHPSLGFNNPTHAEFRPTRGSFACVAFDTQILLSLLEVSPTKSTDVSVKREKTTGQGCLKKMRLKDAL